MASAMSGFLLVERVIAAHQPLQLGELADHPAHEIGLGKMAARSAIVGHSVDQPAIWRASSRMRSTRSYLRAELLVEGDRLSFGTHLVERLS